MVALTWEGCALPVRSHSSARFSGSPAIFIPEDPKWPGIHCSLTQLYLIFGPITYLTSSFPEFLLKATRKQYEEPQSAQTRGFLRVTYSC